MMFYRALQLKKEIKQHQQKLTYWVNLKGIEDPTVLEISQRLDLKVVEMQKIIQKVNR